jgi:hypothetical protein
LYARRLVCQEAISGDELEVQHSPVPIDSGPPARDTYIAGYYVCCVRSHKRPRGIGRPGEGLGLAPLRP